MASHIAPVITPAILSSIRKHPHLPPHSWYFIAATTLSVLNRSDEIHKVYQHAIANGPEPFDRVPGQDEQLRITRRIREALVKAGAIGGLPKTINSLLALKAVTPPHLLDEPLGPSPTGRRKDVYDAPVSDILQRGQGFWDTIYGKLSRRIMGQMERSGTEDLGIVARLMYGHILSNTAVLSRVETSCVLLAALIPQDVNPQLKGHLRGAVNGGATVQEVKAVRDVVTTICRASGMKKLGDGLPGGWGWRGEIANL